MNGGNEMNQEVKKKKNGCLIAVIIVSGIITLVIIAGIIIGISLLKRDMTVEVDFDKQELESAYDKMGMENDNDTPTLNDIFYRKYKASENGHAADMSLSNEEITALFDDMSSRDDYIQNVRFKGTGDGEFEVSFELNNIDEIISEAEQYYPEVDNFTGIIDTVKESLEGAVVYHSGALEYSQENGFEATTAKLKVGILPISEGQQQVIVDSICGLMNRMVEDIDALNINEINITEDGLDFVGTLPDEIDTN
jgi:hypothetical protein